MKRIECIPAAALAAAIVLTRATLASSVIVPDGVPTIQGGIDTGVDTVFVRAGTYDEDLDVGIHSPHLVSLPTFESYMVRVGAVTGGSPQLKAIGFHFRGPVTGTHNGAWLTNCRLDGGLHYSPSGSGSTQLSGCVVQGGLSGGTIGLRLIGNTFIGGGVDVRFEGTGIIESNYFVGPGAFGLRALDSDPSHSRILFNVAEGFVDGIIVAYSHSTMRVEGNIVRDCSGNGFVSTGGRSVTWTANQARRCGGHGFDLAGNHRLEHCTADSTGLTGIHVTQTSSFYFPTRIIGCTVRDAGSHGIWYEDDVPTPGPRWPKLAGNTVERAGGDGIRAEFADSVMYNVTGQCAGAGIRIEAADPDLEVQYNTSYRNGGSGFVVQGGPMQSFDHNIGAFNDGYGLESSVAFVPACNDWFDNGAGATSGVSPGPTDLAVDPQFCDTFFGNVQLMSTSPLLDAPGCGLIGALGLGCVVDTGADDPGTPVAGLRVSPVPARGAIRFAWRPSSEQGRLVVYDLSGARRWSTPVASGEQRVTWDGVDAKGRPLAPGLYWARLERGAEIHTERLVIAR
jgi:hypothetical protein